MPFEVGAFAQVFVMVNSSIVDQDIERFDFLDSVLNLSGVGHVQSQLRDAPIGMGKRLARSRIHALRASLQGFLNQCTADASVRAGDQDCLVFDVHNILLSNHCLFYWLLRIARQGGYVPGERFWFYPASASRSRTSVPPRRAQLGACVCLRTNWSHSVCRNTVGDLVPFLWTLVKRNYRGAYIGRRGR